MAPVFRSCSQMRTTRQPRLRSVWVTMPSRRRFPSIFAFQNSLSRGNGLQPREQPCQKQPSKKMAICCFGKTKSGCPNSRYFRRHPEIPLDLRMAINVNSVVLLPQLRTRDMLYDRLSGVCTSTIAAVYVERLRRRAREVCLDSAILRMCWPMTVARSTGTPLPICVPNERFDLRKRCICRERFEGQRLHERI